jgi:hypothetical protein
MQPGDKIYAPIEIHNLGSLDAVYGIAYSTTTATHDLAGGLNLAIRHLGASTAACTSAAFATGAFSDFTAPIAPINLTMVPSSTTPLTRLVTAASAVQGGAVATGVTLGHAGALGAPTVDVLCLEVTMIDSNANDFNEVGVTGLPYYDTTITFQFDGLVADPTETRN